MATSIAILGGAGAEGSGLAKRYAAAGHPVIIGSRQADRATATAAALNAELGTSLISGADNAGAAQAGKIVILTIPYEGMEQTLVPLAEALSGKIVVSAIVPMDFTGGSPKLIAVPEGSATQRAQALVPGALVVGAFHHLGAATLADLAETVDSDVLVCADNAEARSTVMALASELSGARGVDAGRLDGAGVIEGFTVALLRINRRYRTHAGLRITYLPESGPRPAASRGPA